MNTLDTILFAFLIFGLARGFWRGFFVEIASLIALLSGVYGAFHFSNFASNFLKERVDWNENTVNIVAFFGTLILIVFAIALAGKALTKMANFAALGLFNKLLGGVFGALKIALILSAILIVFEKMNRTLPFTTEADKTSSVVYKPVKGIIPLLFPDIILNGKPIGVEQDNTELLEIQSL
ncbi:CvpA family protein [Mariniflexile sp.]|uniref:CvpA family protein n=1 Tax=Mariniflexile sp. TaxID=1979402 RepID=UPI0035689275